MIHKGDHSDGYSILIIEDDNDCNIHMTDLMYKHAHQNKLAEMSYDDYPVRTVHEKEKWMEYGYEREAWYTFYHDTHYRALRFDKEGKQIGELSRKKRVKQ